MIFDPVGEAKAMYRPDGRPRVLLIMPPKIASVFQPHLGLGILAARLASGGFSPFVLDYSYAESLPDVGLFTCEIQPHLIGVSLFSQYLHESERFIEKLHNDMPDTPIIVGGPHVSLANEEGIDKIKRLPGVTRLVKGEADNDIVEIARAALTDRSRKVVECNPVPMDCYCRPDFSRMIRGLQLRTYPMQMSRGCPYRCAFCNIARMSGRKFRVRKVEDGIEEIAEAVGRYKEIQYVKVTDDAPNCIEGRFEEFLEAYVSKGFRPKLEIMQLRADHLTLGMCRLMKKAGSPFICLAVESADPTVLADVKKGETLQQIERACGYVRSCDLPLILCFVLGLPGATRKSDMTSIAFARRMKPIHCYWNIAQPVPGTEMHAYFAKNGRFYSDNAMAGSSLDGVCPADTPEYPREERLGVQAIAQATTNERPARTMETLRQAAHRGILLPIAQALLAPRPKIPGDTPRRW